MPVNKNHIRASIALMGASDSAEFFSKTVNNYVESYHVSTELGNKALGRALLAHMHFQKGNSVEAALSLEDCVRNAREAVKQISLSGPRGGENRAKSIEEHHDIVTNLQKNVEELTRHQATYLNTLGL